MKDNRKYYVSAKAVAERYGIGVSTVWLWTKDGTLPKPIRFGNRCTRWEESTLDKYDQTVNGGAA